MASLAHIGTPHDGAVPHSGRYKWGSGDDPKQRNRSFLDSAELLARKGLTEKEIADALGVTTGKLRAMKAIAKNERRDARRTYILTESAKGRSNSDIARSLGVNESMVRRIISDSDQKNVAVTTSEMLAKELASKELLDVGSGTSNMIGISSTKLDEAVAILEEQGYKVYSIRVPQVDHPGQYNRMKILAPPGTEFADVVRNRFKIQTVGAYSDDLGENFHVIKPPVSISSKRIKVNYGEDGGSEKDGLIELRRGVDDISLGAASYAQVRIAVDGSHYLKGMAAYRDDMPDGVDVIFNTNKHRTSNKLDAMKAMKDDPGNPFGAVVKHQREYIGKDGKKHQSAINIVREEGDWEQWSRNLASQMLSKQPISLAKDQLKKAYLKRKLDLDAINEVTNPVVKRKLLEAFADKCDSAAVDLQAAAMPRQITHVILPVPSMKDTEVYAPNYRNGERVALIRYPHGGIFEIPELTVNNRHAGAKKALGKNPRDAIGISSKVAERLSGADFDGDFVMVIPNNHGRVKTARPLRELKDFDPKKAYPAYKGMPRVANSKGVWPAKQRQMGDVSNLITDMTIKGASQSEIARAVRHSMVIIDAEKHNLDWKRSYSDNGIAQLKMKYQGGPKRGASTLISKASSDAYLLERKPRSYAKGGPIDAKTGRRMWEPTNRVVFNPKTGKSHMAMTKSSKMAETRNAHSLSSGSKIESVYADHANALKALANSARKTYMSTPSLKYSPQAKKRYAKEVASLNAKLNIAMKDKPLQRKVHLVANELVAQKRAANPDMTAKEMKKVKAIALQDARARLGAKRHQIDITDAEWKAIQSGAITNNKLEDIISNASLERVQQLATPHTVRAFSAQKKARAAAMIANGKTYAEVADALGVSVSTLRRGMNE